MDGVNILATNVYRELDFGEFLFFFVTFVGLYSCILWLIYIMHEDRYIPGIGAFLVSIVLSALLILALSVLCQEYKTIYTDYLVTVNDTVSINEFTTHYEIMKQEGTLFTVRERGVDNE